MDLPIIIYNINKEVISKITISKNNCFYFYSYKNINVRIISGIGILYSVIENIDQNNVSTLQTFEGQNFSNNFGYTLYIPINKSSVKIEITVDNNIVSIYEINLQLDNIINEINTHYLDLLINNNLPNFDELEQAIPDEFNKSELIKRLLLDFKSILKHKGTKKSIENFLEFIGFKHSNLTINDEYIDSKGITTTNPNKLTDKKTGNYHVFYDNYNETGFDKNNLPVRELIINELNNFQTHLLHTIALANKYFTSEEQYINFFGLNYSSNIPYEQSITSNMNVIYENDVFGFRKNVKINILNYIDSTKNIKIVENCLQKESKLFKSEIKTYIKDSVIVNPNIFEIDNEIYDNEDISNYDFQYINRLFGNVLHINIKSPNTYIEIKISDKNNLENILKYENIYITNEFNKQIVLKNTTSYLIEINITDIYNNTEKYFYRININSTIQRIDFQNFCSYSVSEQNKLDNEIEDINTFIKNSSIGLPYKLPFQFPINSDNISDYIKCFPYKLPFKLFNHHDIESLSNFYSIFILPEMIGKIGDYGITTKIPQELNENWLPVLFLKYDYNYELKIRFGNIIESINNAHNYQNFVDELFVMVTDIFDRDINDKLQNFKTPYYYITTTKNGIDLTKELYDFVLVNKNDNSDIISVFDTEILKTKIPVNYDFPLFELKSEQFPNFESYISPNCYKETIEGIEYPVIKSIFPRLKNVTNQNFDEYILDIGDIILCKLDSKYVINSKNIIWKVFNSFTNELLFEINDMSLKYRLEDNIFYDVSCDFEIDETQYNIFKKSLFLSFKIKM